MTKKISLRLITILLAVCMLFSVTACSSTKPDSDATDSGSDVVNVDTRQEDDDKDDSSSNNSSDKKDDSSKNDSSSNNSSDKKDDSSKNNSSSNNSSDKKDDSSKNNSSSNNSSDKKDDSSKKTSLTKEQVIAKMPAKLKGTTIKYMYWWNPKDQMEAEAIASFEKKTGIKIQPIVASYNGFYSEVAAKIAAGDSPDIVRLMFADSTTLNLLQPITNSGFDFNDTAWHEKVLADYTFNGNTYAVNLAKSAVMDYAVIYYNKNALKAAEMQDPYTLWKKNPSSWTWAKFWQMCDEFVKANKKSSDTYYGSVFEYPDAFVRAMGGCVYDYDSKNGKYINKITSNAMKVGWQRTLSAIDKKWLAQEFDVSLFDSGKALFYWSGPYSVRKGDARQEALKKQNALGIVPLPTDSKNQTLYEYTAFGICKGAKNAAAAPYYLRWVLDQSSYDMDNLYATKEASEVMKYVSSKENLFYGSYWYTALFNDLYNGGTNQVQSVLDSYKNTVNLTVQKLNEGISLY